MLQQNYISNPNPTQAVIEDWTAQQGDMANVSILKQALKRQGLGDSLACLEKVLSPDATDAPLKMTDIITGTQNLQVSSNEYYNNFSNILVSKPHLCSQASNTHTSLSSLEVLH